MLKKNATPVFSSQGKFLLLSEVTPDEHKMNKGVICNFSN